MTTDNDKRVTWITTFGSDDGKAAVTRCARCDARQLTTLPVSISQLHDVIVAFRRVHDACKPRAVRAER